MDPYGVGFVVDAVQVFHCSEAELPASLPYVMFIALQADDQINNPSGGTREQTLQWERLFVVVGCERFCFFDVRANVAWFVAWLHTNKPPLRVYVLWQFCSTEDTL